MASAARPITVEKTEQSLRAGPDRVPALFPAGERVAFAGVADGAQAVGIDVDLFGIG